MTPDLTAEEVTITSDVLGLEKETITVRPTAVAGHDGTVSMAVDIAIHTSAGTRSVWLSPDRASMLCVALAQMTARVYEKQHTP